MTFRRFVAIRGFPTVLVTASQPELSGLTARCCKKLATLPGENSWPPPRRTWPNALSRTTEFPSMIWGEDYATERRVDVADIVRFDDLKPTVYAAMNTWGH